MRGLSASTRALIQFAREILTDDHPQTARQVHYRIFSLGLAGYKNDKASYRRLCRVLVGARRSWRRHELFIAPIARSAGVDVENAAQILAVDDDGIPSNWIVDELRQGERVNVFENAQEYIEAVRESYRRDFWQNQSHYVELWGEKGTVLGALRPIAREWGLMLRVCRGFGSAAMEDQIGRLFENIYKPITVFYVGDHDASGVLIEQDMHRRVQTASGVDFEMIRLAVQKDDIERFHLPPQRIKDSDSRARSFRKQFGADAATVELEALPVAELKRRIEEAVRSLIDFDEWNRQADIQYVELASIQAFADTMKNLPQIGGPA